MLLEGSCHCRAVRFSVESREPVPYQRCYCTVCRKTGGSGGFMINLGADAATLKVEGQAHTSTYQAQIEREGKMVQSGHRRLFCRLCGSHLWASNDRWPELLHPVSSAIDTELPVPPHQTHLMLNYKASWVQVPQSERDRYFDEYPDQSLAEWHSAQRATGLIPD